MRLSEEAKARVLDAARRHVSNPALVRIGTEWAVVGRDPEQPARWAGLLVSRVETGGVWWSSTAYAARRRGDVVRELRACSWARSMWPA